MMNDSSFLRSSGVVVGSAAFSRLSEDRHQYQASEIIRPRLLMIFRRMA